MDGTVVTRAGIARADVPVRDGGVAEVVTIREDVISKVGWTPFACRPTRGDVVRVPLPGEEVGGGAQHHVRAGRFLPGAGAAGRDQVIA